MLNAITTAKALNWQSWLLGLVGATISGGSGAIAAGFGSVMLDPQHFNVMQGGLKHTTELMGMVFLVSAIISLAKFLQQHPVPNEVNGNDRP